MSDETNDNRSNDALGLDETDRLPWLETADGYDYDEGASPLKVAAMVMGGLLLLAAIVGGIFWVQRNQSGAPTGNGELIAAPKGDYKAKPEESGGKTFEGEGDSAFAASEGQKTGATLAPQPKTAEPKVAVAPPATAKPAEKSSAPAGAVMVQLGAFGDTAKAEAAWAAFGKRFGFLSGTNRRIAEASVEGGRKIFRLQAVTANAAAAQQLCAKLKAAGENCLIVR